MAKPLPSGDLAMIRLAPPLMLLGASALATERLGGYPVDPAQVSVCGMSSGAFMANHLYPI
ncbi:MAG: hypothetical protein WB715_24465 [Roseiarcus sp.]|uniref:hypothetical protein n=1 Tax=Roseiarcus sp. TaxID=1969460 RepID=UPI003C3116D8